VDIQLHTGRTHQIRVPFFPIGFSLFGGGFFWEPGPCAVSYY